MCKIDASRTNSHAGAAYMVYRRGNASLFAHPFDVAWLNGTDGFRMVGSGGDGEFGGSLAGVGDFNGDGADDVVIGAWAAGNARIRVINFPIDFGKIESSMGASRIARGGVLR